MMYLGGCFVPYLQSTGSVLLIVGYLQQFLTLISKGNLTFVHCRLNMINVLRGLYNINIMLTLILVCLSTFKAEGLLLRGTSWEQLLAPLYFFMTELLLIAIVSFVVLVNSVIQLCCNQGSRASRLARNYQNSNAQESNSLISNHSALVRVSVWFLYVAVCGLLCLFLMLKNASSLKGVASTPDPALADALANSSRYKSTST
jgi:hypothetical protein